MKRKPSRYIIYYIGRALQVLILLLPIRLWLLSAGFFGNLCYYFLGRERRRTLEHLSAAMPELSEFKRRQIAKGVFRNIIRNFFEVVSFPKLRTRYLKNRIECVGFERIKEALKAGKGAITLTGHIGNWEFSPAPAMMAGMPGSIIVRRIYFEKYNAFISRIRSSLGVDIIYREESPKKILRVLKSGHLLGMLADQDIDSVDGVFVDFFGRPTYTPTAPVALSLSSGAPIIPVYLIREGLDRFRFFVERPIESDKSRPKDEEILRKTQQWSSILESYIRKYPDQWVWMHRRWKTQPAQ